MGHWESPRWTSETERSYPGTLTVYHHVILSDISFPLLLVTTSPHSEVSNDRPS